ncbi:hypothetical protein [Limosilactobacillus pontis]|uniref:hypothetical protein n=1 Tax=Limosilactobacillus pontis TaxID=35787 RepID=UPI002245B240|nr:hypothetical protein [Limosilactobacillus pontis]MCX2186355.1 hypothetical protein [Limosilactobacillus pontis]MCX2188041.1 hypothetical protein [Limosilactobacillus pontis]
MNALGNGLTVATNVGTSPWTASEVNIAQLVGTSVGLPMFCVGVLVAIVNQLLIRQWDPLRFFGEIGFIACFSYFVNVFVAFFTWLGVPHLPFLLRAVLCFLGVATFCCAISIYQRANLVMHPNDDTTNILRFLYCHNRVVVAQLVNFIPPIAIMVVTFLISGHLFALLANGPLIGFFDRHVWHGLTHNFRVKGAGN